MTEQMPEWAKQLAERVDRLAESERKNAELEQRIAEQEAQKRKTQTPEKPQTYEPFSGRMIDDWFDPAKEPDKFGRDGSISTEWSAWDEEARFRGYERHADGKYYPTIRTELESRETKLRQRVNEVKAAYSEVVVEFPPKSGVAEKAIH